MSDDGRNPDGTFAPGNTAHLTCGGGYGLEQQVYDGKVSPRLMSAALKAFEHIQAGGAAEMHDELAALAYAVTEGLKATLSHASEKLEAGETEENLSKLFRADRSLHSWVALTARLLEWSADHPSDGKTSARHVLEAIQGDNEHK